MKRLVGGNGGTDRGDCVYIYIEKKCTHRVRLDIEKHLIAEGCDIHWESFDCGKKRE